MSDVARVERSETRGLSKRNEEPRVSLRSTQATFLDILVAIGRV